MSETKLQFSAGGVIYRRRNKEIAIVLLTRGSAQPFLQKGLDESKIFCLPKGKIEKSETPQEAALREVKEETGLSGTIEKELGKIRYWFYSEEDKPRPFGGKHNGRIPKERGKARVHKTVTFFLIRYESGDTSDHDTDAEEARWLPIDRALKIMTYPSERQMVERARELL